MGSRLKRTGMTFAIHQMAIQIISAAITMYLCCHCKFLNILIILDIDISINTNNDNLFYCYMKQCDIFFIDAKMEMNIRPTVVRAISRINYLKGHVIGTPMQELDTFASVQVGLRK